MWLYTKQGMISVVQKLEGFHFRSRDRASLDYLNGLVGNRFTVLESYPGSDYEWRIIAGKRPARIAFSALFDDIDYDNFKNAACDSLGYGRGELWNVYGATQRAHPSTPVEWVPEQEEPPRGLDYSETEQEPSVAELIAESVPDPYEPTPGPLLGEKRWVPVH